MPNIRQFTSQVSGLEPTDRGAEGYNQEARRVGTFYHQIGSDLGQGIASAGAQYVDHVTTDQMMTGMKLKTQATEQLMQNWNDTLAKDQAAPVHNPHLFDDWKKANLDPAMDQLGETFSTKEGQEWWAQQANQLQQHFMEHGLADQSTLAAGNAVRDYEATGNSAQSLSYNDPGSGNLARGMMDQAKTAAIRALGPNASPQALEALENHATVTTAAITIAQARGMIDKAPDPDGAAKQFLSSPEATQYLDESQRAAVESYGNQVTRQLAEKAKAATTQARKQLEDEGHLAYSQMLIGITNPKTGEVNPGPRSFQQAFQFANKYGGVLPAEAKSLHDVLTEAQRRRNNHEDTQDDPYTYSRLMSSAGKPEGQGGLTTADVDSAYAQGRLSDHSYAKLHEMVEQNKEDPAVRQGWSDLNRVMEALKPSITASTPFSVSKDTTGDTAWATYQGAMKNNFDIFVAKGEPPAQVLREMMNPQDKQHYVGNYVYNFQHGLKNARAPNPVFHPDAYQRPAAPEPGAPNRGDIHGVGVDGVPSAHATIGGGGVAAAQRAASSSAHATLTPQQLDWLKANGG